MWASRNHHIEHRALKLRATCDKLAIRLRYDSVRPSGGVGSFRNTNHNQIPTVCAVLPARYHLYLEWVTMRAIWYAIRLERIGDISRTGRVAPKMKIGYVCADPGIPVLGNKGASVHVREFTDALVALGHEVMIVSAADEFLEGAVNTTAAALRVMPSSIETKAVAWRMATSLSRLGWQREPAHMKSEMRHILGDAEFTTGALAILKDFGPDLIIARHALFSIAGIELARGLGCPCVLEVNAPLREERRRYWGLTLDEVAAQAESFVFTEADLLVAVSEGVRGYLLRCGATADRVMVVPNGVDVARFHPGVDRTLARDHLGLADEVVIGFAGSLKPWHGLDLLMRAFADLTTRHAANTWGDTQAGDLRLVIVGDGPEHGSLEQLASQLMIDRLVTFTGAVAHHQIPAHLAAFDIAVAPYASSDGFYFSPLKIMEYLAMGLPVVAPSLGQIPLLLAGNEGPAGLLYSPDDTQELAGALLKLIRDPALRHTLGNQGAQQARQHYAWTAVAQRILRRVKVRPDRHS